MTFRHLLSTSLALALCACANADAPPAATAPAGDAPQAQAAATDGSLDLDFSVRSIDRNSSGDTASAQCQLQFTATNRSQAPVTSLIAEFRFTRASDGSAIENEASLVMPFEIPPGETLDAWGAITIDNHRCDDIQIALQVPKAGMCNTQDESPCPVYRLSGEGVASVQ